VCEFESHLFRQFYTVEFIMFLLVSFVVTLVIGYLCGIHAPWWAQVMIVWGFWLLCFKDSREIEAALYVPAFAGLAFGVIMGDIAHIMVHGTPFHINFTKIFLP
jgi:hypothetical protein